jgi:hypothetical protein
MGREDALPRVPEKLAVRTARHVNLHFKTRCIRDGRRMISRPTAHGKYGDLLGARIDFLFALYADCG